MMLPKLRNEPQQTARHTRQLALPGSAVLLCQFILLCLFYNLRLDLDQLLQLININVAAVQWLFARPCWNAPLHW